jgi:hypothetical protein
MTFWDGYVIGVVTMVVLNIGFNLIWVRLAFRSLLGKGASHES